MDAKAMRKRQAELLEQVAALGPMRRGTITHQRVARAGGRVAVHPLLSWKEEGKTRSLRLPTPRDVAWAERAVDNHQRFTRLIKEYEDIGGELALVQREAAAPEGAEKKGR